jgi:hypothetical protein
LIEAFDIPDSVLNTAIGNKYGDIYEDYINHARASKLNQGEDPQRRILRNSNFLPIVLQKKSDPLAKL